MPRTKTVAQKKRRRDAEGAIRYPLNIRKRDKELFAAHKSKKVFRPNVVLDWDVLRQFGVVQDFQGLLTDRAWYNLFMVEEDLYEEMLLAFLATFKISGPMKDGVENEVEFLARGEYHRMSMVEFIGAMGIYDEGYLRTPEFRALPISWGGEYSSTFWSSIGIGPYSASHTKASALKSRVYHILHYIMARSTTGRIDSEGVVNARDLFQFWAMRTGTRVNVGVFAAFCILRQAEKGPKGFFLGALVIRILKNLGLFPTRAPSDWIGRSLKLKAKVLIDWGFNPAEEGAEERVEEEAGEEENVDTAAHIGEATSSAQMPDSVSRFSRDIKEVKKNQKLLAGQLCKVEKR